jgi:hypothetical protein
MIGAEGVDRDDEHRRCFGMSTFTRSAFAGAEQNDDKKKKPRQMPGLP